VSADPRFTFRVPGFAARHRHPLVVSAIELAREAFSDRFDLRRPVRDRWGNVIREALHMFLCRATGRPATRRDGQPFKSAEDLDGRRADHFQTMLSLWVTMIAVADFETWELREPVRELAKTSPHPTMLRLAELADLVPEKHGLTDAPDNVWRARAELENGGILSFTKEWRVEKEDGSHYSAGGALRRLSHKVLAAVGGPFGREILDQIDATKKKRAQRKQEAAEFKKRVDGLWAAEARAAAAAAAVSSEPAAPATSSAEDIEIDRIHEETGWPFRRCLAEARRRLREMARAGPIPAD
jgi:hypothetical protein